MFATPCSENVRASIFGDDRKNEVIELHRLHILDITPHNTESWFISRCLKMLKQDKPQIKAVISFSDTTQGHNGTIYQASNFYFIGKTSPCTFYIDENNRLRHPRQNGVNITKDMAEQYGWTPVKRMSKNRYLIFLADSKVEKKRLLHDCKYDVLHKVWCAECGKEMEKGSSRVCLGCLAKQKNKNNFVKLLDKQNGMCYNMCTSKAIGG